MNQLIKDYATARNIFTHALDKFPQDKRDTILFGDWTVKDILAHIIGWEKQSIQKVKDIQDNKEPHIIKDVDAFNAQITSQYKAKDWETTYQEFLDSGSELIKTYTNLPDHLWDKSVKNFIKAETGHYQGEHLVQLVQSHQYIS